MHATDILLPLSLHGLSVDSNVKPGEISTIDSSGARFSERIVSVTVSGSDMSVKTAQSVAKKPGDQYPKI
jgi:hypothetical protein